MLHLFKLSILALAFFFHSPMSHASNVLPPFLDKLPLYEVKLTTKISLPQARFQLTNRALRILPKFFIHAQKILKKNILISPYAGKIELIHSGDKQYCQEKHNLCWPQSIVATSGYLMVTDWNNKTIYYKDSHKLAEFLWKETLSPLSQTVKNRENK